MVLFSQDDTVPSECDDDDLVSYFGVCAACKLAINHYRNFNFSALDFLSARSSTCPFCGLRYRDGAERQAAESDNIESIEDGKETDCRREQRSSSDPTVPRYRLPPIVSSNYIIIIRKFVYDLFLLGIHHHFLTVRTERNPD